MRRSGLLAAAVLAALALFGGRLAVAKEFLLVATRPSTLHVIDVSARQVVKSISLPAEPGAGPTTIMPSPDGKRAYVIVNRWESVSGVDLDTGKEVFRADLSTPQERVKIPFASVLSPDGKQLYVFESPVRLGLGEYHVQNTRIAVFNTEDGINAKPVRTFEAPRRIILMSMSPDGKHLYGLGWDLYDFDPATGKIVKTYGVRNWKRPNYGEPDVLDVWPQYEQTNLFVTPYVAARTDRPATAPDAYKVGLMTFDLANPKLDFKDYEDFTEIVFSSVANPKNRNEIYSVYTTLSKVDNSAPNEGKILKRVVLPHTYYALNISEDGKELYLGGTMSDVGVYSTDTLERIGEIKLPGGGDMQLSSVRIIRR